jgi:hypothetical protein
MRLLFEPPRRHRRLVMLSALDVALLAVLGLAFLLLDIVFRQVLEPRDVDYLRLLMAASWIVVFILEYALAYLRQ